MEARAEEKRTLGLTGMKPLFQAGQGESHQPHEPYEAQWSVSRNMMSELEKTTSIAAKRHSSSRVVSSYARFT